jgi:hypothetical protein
MAFGSQSVDLAARVEDGQADDHGRSATPGAARWRGAAVAERPSGGSTRLRRAERGGFRWTPAGLGTRASVRLNRCSLPRRARSSLATRADGQTPGRIQIARATARARLGQLASPPTKASAGFWGGLLDGWGAPQRASSSRSTMTASGGSHPLGVPSVRRPPAVKGKS